MDQPGPHEKDTAHAPATAAMADDAQPDAARRRFGQRGLRVSGLLLTLACRPVLGAVAQSPSGFLSANQSRHGEIREWAMNHGTGPGWWCCTSAWPIPPETRFAALFGAAAGTIYDVLTLLEMVKGNAQDTDELGKHLTAALLSARSGWTPFLPETTIFAMFREWRTTGFYAPAANVQWTAADIVAYLKATMVMVGFHYKSQG